MSYPTIMRERALKAPRGGKSGNEVNETYGFGTHTLKDWEKLEKETGSSKKRPLAGNPCADLEALRKYCEENPFATHIEAGVCFGCGERVIRRAKDKLEITRKKDAILCGLCGAKRARTSRLPRRIEPASRRRRNFLCRFLCR
jgi:hypothetical protein